MCDNEISWAGRNRGSYISTHVLMNLLYLLLKSNKMLGLIELLNLLNMLRKSNEMRGLPRVLLLFRNKFNKLDNKGARTLDSIYHMTLNFL